MKPRVLILFATGTNRDGDAALAFQAAGAETDIFPIRVLREQKISWQDYQILVIPGGFSYADALGAGKLMALDLSTYFKDEVSQFVAAGKPVIGICNGFQALVKSGILPGRTPANGIPKATLTFNQSGHFECRWVHLKNESSVCLWTRDLGERLIDCPVAHGEGNFQVTSAEEAALLKEAGQIALTYRKPNGEPAGGSYPYNPNGSIIDIAGICNPTGNVLGLMPHPEDHIFDFQNPNRKRGMDYSGLPMFKNGVTYAAES